MLNIIYPICIKTTSLVHEIHHCFQCPTELGPVDRYFRLPINDDQSPWTSPRERRFDL